ncbi:aminotransferase class V-fold PLP-dependent enzyme [Kiloniella laminariae]|uniref:Aminotransferase class V-fold PLP-dependent enzyme n=1 Tax=Kiloniella laminariae TaxID=454162 RepID=A0ABT4LJY0_9PROT|nr:aminotransferase class V-fold PLP-dependent enzyme [Kiloniella laminariae]MCZ4281413.1 aminotransferase class V-fold PLP-dependent enzyme [Kiloniella laminariae]
MTRLDLDFIRAQFPAFEEPSLQNWSFFENAGGSYACTQVIEHLNRYYRQTKLQPYHPFPASERAGQEMDQALSRLASYLNVGEDEIDLGPSTSQNTYVLAQAFRAILQPGDEIIVTNQDHEANSGSWRRLSESGIVIREWQVDPQTGYLDLEVLDQLLGDKTRLVTFPHCSNIIAQVNPVAEITRRAHAVGARVVVDGVSYAGHGFPDVKALEADIYLFSLYKTFGPHQGLMVVRKETREALANQGHFFNADLVHKRLTPAGPDHAQIAASGGIIDYFDAVHTHHFKDQPDAARRGHQIHDLFQAQEKALMAPLLEYIRNRNDVRLLGPDTPTDRAPTISMVVKGGGRAAAEKLAKHGIMAAGGHFYSFRLFEGMNLDPAAGALRVSFVHYTSPDDIEKLIKALDATL